MTGTLHRQVRITWRVLCIVVTAALFVALVPTSTNSDFENRPRYSKKEIKRAIAIYAKRFRLDPALLRAVIKTESDFRQHVVSRKGAVGLMQLTPKTAASLRVADIHDPIQNLRGGAKHLRQLLNLYDGDLRLALAAYNAGTSHVKRHRLPRIRETRAYVKKVLRHYHRYRLHRPVPGRTNPPRLTGRLVVQKTRHR